MELQVSASMMASMNAGLATQLDRGPLLIHAHMQIYKPLVRTLSKQHGIPQDFWKPRL